MSKFHISHCQDWLSSELVRPTLSGLVDLARCCSHLTWFRFPKLDVNVVPEKDTALPLGHGLRTFSVKNAILPPSKSPRYLEAATVLDRVFPSIGLKSARLNASSSLAAKRWKNFLRLLETARRKRRESKDGPSSADAADFQVAGPAPDPEKRQ